MGSEQQRSGSARPACRAGGDASCLCGGQSVRLFVS